MRLYVAGPMTGYPEHNLPAFHQVTTRLRGAGHIVYCPAETFGGDVSLAEDVYARFDLHLLLQAEGIVLLDGWEASRGACTELAVAHWLGLQPYVMAGLVPHPVPVLVPNPLQAWLDRRPAAPRVTWTDLTSRGTA